MGSAWGPALLSSGVVGALIPLLVAWMNRRQTRALATKTDAERDDTLEKARETAQKTALDSAAAAYASVERRCKDCETQLEELEKKYADALDLMEKVCDAVEALMSDDNRATRAQARLAIRAVRHITWR